MNKIIGIVGMCGSGKSVATDFFTNLGWKKIYFGGVTIDELNRRNLPVNEQNERSIREKLREEYGPAAYAIMLSERIKESALTNNTVLDGLYSWYEYVHLKQQFGEHLVILAVITDRNIRYERLLNRPVRPLTNDNAIARDFAEIENLAKGGPIAIADYYVTNNGSPDELCNQLESILKNL